MCTEVTQASHYVHRSYTGIPLCAQKLHWRPTMCTDLSYTRVPLGVKMLTSVFQSAGKVLSIPPLCAGVADGAAGSRAGPGLCSSPAAAAAAATAAATGGGRPL